MRRLRFALAHALLRATVAAGRTPSRRAIDRHLARVAAAAEATAMAAAADRLRFEPWKARRALLESLGMARPRADATLDRWRAEEPHLASDGLREDSEIERIRVWCRDRGWELLGPLQLPRDGWYALLVARSRSAADGGRYGWGRTALEAAESARSRVPQAAPSS